MVKEGYKETEIGVIPEDWGLISFKECFNILPNNTLPRSVLSEHAGTIKNIHYGDILVRYDSILNCSKEQIPFIMSNSHKKHSLIFLLDGDVVIADTAEDETVGKTVEITNVGEQKIVAGLHTIPCRTFCNDLFVNGWLGYYVNSNIYHNQLLPLITGTKVSAISKSAISETVILVPPLEEQQKIVEALSDMDNLISALEKLIEKKKAIKQACLQKMFPKEGELVPEMRLPGFTDAWEQRKFEEIAVRSSVICSDDTLPRVEYEDIVSGTGRLNKDIYAKQSIKSGIAFHQGDVLYGKLRPYLQNWLLPTFDGLAVGDFWVLQPQNADSSFLYRLIQSRQFDEVANQSTGTKMPRADWKLVSKTVFSIPSNISEQAAIGTYFTALDSLIALHQCKLEKCKKIKEGMMQQLLTGKIRLTSDVNTAINETKSETVKVPSNGHNHQFDDAVAIAGIVDKFYSNRFYLGRKKVQKLLYLFRRHQEADTSAFKKKAAGPYADEVRYKGGEPIAKHRKYVSVKKSQQGSLFSKGENISEALKYISDWGLNDDFEWLLAQFKYIKTDRLELLATIDMAMCDLVNAGEPITVDSIRNLIQSHSEWKAKLTKNYFRDNDIAWAIIECRKLFN